MKQFVSKILVFILPIIILAYPLDYIFSYYLKKSNKSPGEFEVWNDIYSSKASCDIAIYGSSRAWVHFDPKIISDSLGKSVYNFGIDGHNFWIQYLRHKEFLKHNDKPKVIILSVDVFTLQKRIDLYQPDQFLPYMLYNRNIRNFTSSYVGYRKIDYYLPLIRYMGKTGSLNTIMQNIFTRKESANYRNRGFKGMDLKWNSDLEQAKRSKDYYEVILDTGSIKLFEQFIIECKKSGIELVFVYTPEYIEGQKYVSNRNDIIKIYRDYSKKYNLSFLDYSNDEMCLDKSLFYNASHLNTRGAEIFSKKIAHYLKTSNLFE